MKTLIFLITIIAATSLVRAEENHEVIWETEQIGGLNEVEVSPLGEVFYNTKDSIIQVRSVETGELIEEILFPNTARLDAISISADGRYMAVSGQPKYIFIYDLVEKREVKRLTALVFEQEEFGKNVEYEAEKWVCSSISPDGTKVTGVAISDRGRNKSNFIVFDVESENVIYESRRQSYDMNNPSSSNYWWRSAEFTPDGKYIVSQLDYRTENSFGPDSIYIHDANNFEVYDMVLNNYNTTTSEIKFSKFEPVFTTTNNSSLSLYDFRNKKTDTLYFGKTPMDVIFSRQHKSILVRIFVSLPTLYNYENKMLFDEISYFGIPRAVTLDDRLIYWHPDGKLALVEINWEPITGIRDESNNKLELSPNPTTGEINLGINNKILSEFQYELINVSGQIIKSNLVGFVQPNSQSVINISDVPNGHYTLRIFSEREEFTFNIIKEG